MNMTNNDQNLNADLMDKCKEEGYIEIVKNKGACITLKGKDILSAYINMETWN